MGKEDFKFQVIAGQLKGRTITAPDLGITRPPLTRIRRAIFDFLWPYLEDANYLDLYSGTGSYLFEAVSRGAKNAIGIEMERKLADAINTQAEKFGVGDKLKCLCQDVFEAIPTLHKSKNQFDVIMIAPPQYQGLIDRTLLCLKEYPVMTRGGIILCQHDTSEKNKIVFADFEIKEERKYGNTTFTVLNYE